MYLTYSYGKAAQDRQVRLEQISKFDATSMQIIEAAGAFIVAINNEHDLGPSRAKLSAALATQIHDSRSLENTFEGADRIVREYQDAIAELNQIAQKTASANDMRPWTESFGRVLDYKAALSNRLRPRA